MGLLDMMVRKQVKCVPEWPENEQDPVHFRILFDSLLNDKKESTKQKRKADAVIEKGSVKKQKTGRQSKQPTLETTIDEFLKPFGVYGATLKDIEHCVALNNQESLSLLNKVHR